MTDIWLLIGLFISALTSATVLPGSSEAVLLGLMVKGLNSYVLWTVATVGNVLGSLISWWMGKAALHYQDRKWFPVGRAKLEQAQGWFKKYGTPALLLSWLPGIGDAFSVAAGILRVPLLSFVVLVTIAKGFRYAMVVGGADWLGLREWFA